MTTARTSAIETDPEIAISDWEEDATYEYYLHGPLARMELGQQKVQGLDYAYTLQGWIKGVNGDFLDSSRDIGEDGQSLTGVGKDALGYALSYYEGDYQPIGNVNFGMTLPTNSTLNSQSKNLYNGNIRYMSIHNEALGDPIAYSYEYDQLHRIRQMQSINNTTGGTWQTGSISGDFAMNATYDGNGNIQALNRFGIQNGASSSSQINQLDYVYQPGTNLLIGTEDRQEILDESTGCEDMLTIDQTQAGGTISSNEVVIMKTMIDGSQDYIIKTGKTICFEPGFGMNGIGGKLAALTQETCEPTTTTMSSDTTINARYCYDKNGNMVLNADGAVITWTPYGKVKSVKFPEEDGTIGGEDGVDIVINEPITMDTEINACETITGGVLVEGDNTVILTAGESITFLPGFEFDPNNGGTLSADIAPPTEPCEEIIPIAESQFGYDAAQNRVLKTVFNEQDTTKTYYVRDAQGNMMATYRVRNDSLVWQEQHLYGSSRLGIVATEVTLDETMEAPYFANTTTSIAFRKRYELSNHLGNVLSVVNGIRRPASENGTSIAKATIVSATDYYPFGLEMEGRMMKDASYRFGFNGKEKDGDGEWGNSAHYDYGFRIYDPSIARFLSVDPLTSSYPWYTPYQFAGNKPIWAIDLDGLEEHYNTEIGREIDAALMVGNALALAWEGSMNLGITVVGKVIPKSIKANKIRSIASQRGINLPENASDQFLVDQYIPRYALSGDYLIERGSFWSSGFRTASDGLNVLAIYGGGGSPALAAKVPGKFSKDLINGVNQVKGRFNCSSCALAVDQRLKGNMDAKSLADEDVSKYGVFSLFKQLFGDSQVKTEVKNFGDVVTSLKEGEIGIVTISPVGKIDGHAFNIAKLGGKVKILDGQHEQIISTDQFRGWLSKFDQNAAVNFYNTTDH